jgi:hypothetical protein
MISEKYKNKIGSGMRIQTVGITLVGKFLSPVNFTLLFFTFLKTYDIVIPKEIMAILGILIFSGVFIIGFLYDRTGLWSKELTWDGKRNLMFQEVMKKIDKLEEKIK